jgi:hypothetical protein
MGNGIAVSVTKSKIIGRRRFGSLLGALALSHTVGCLGARDSLIEKGERVDTGRRRFDAYFEEVAELRDEVEKLDSDLFPLRQPLVEELDLSVDVALGDLLEAAKKRANKVRDFGVSMTLRLRPVPTVDNEVGELESGEKQETFIAAIEESANRAMKTFEEYSALLDKAAALDRKRNDLAERIDKLPPDVDKSLIEREIVGAGKVIRKSEKKLLKDSRTISHFLVGLVASVDTGATAAHDEKCAEAIAFHEENKKKKRKPRPRRRWRPPAGGRRPAPKPKPKPPAGGDFEM